VPLPGDAAGVPNVASIHGRLSIDLSKFFVLAFPALLQLDMAVASLAAEASHRPEFAAEHGWLSNSPPTQLLVWAVQWGSLSVQAACRVLLTSSRPSTVVFYASCHGLALLKGGERAAASTVAPSVLNGGGEHSSALSAPSASVQRRNGGVSVQAALLRIIAELLALCGGPVGADSIGEGVGEGEDCWFCDPMQRSAAKALLGVDVAALIAKLSRDIRSSDASLLVV
jgi:hypothetical protein